MRSSKKASGNTSTAHLCKTLDIVIPWFKPDACAAAKFLVASVLTAIKSNESVVKCAKQNIVSSHVLSFLLTEMRNSWESELAGIAHRASQMSQFQQMLKRLFWLLCNLDDKGSREVKIMHSVTL